MLNLHKALRLIHKQDDRMQVQTMLVLLTVAEFGPISMSQLRETVGLSQSSVSRNCAALGEIHRKGMPGLRLITAHEDPMDRKQKIVQLTKKGENLMTKIRATQDKN